MCFTQSALAESELINSVVLEQPTGKITAELWGDSLDSGYNKELLLLLKDEKGVLITAYRPDIRGGYAPYLQSLKLKGKDKDQQLLLAVGEGNWKAATSYRIYDVKNAEKVQEIFTAEDNLGVVDGAELQGNSLKITLQDGRSFDVALDEKVVPEKIRGNGRLDFQKIHSLSIYSGNSDGKDIIFSDQQIMADNRLLADVGAIYYYQDQEEKKDKPAEAGKEDTKVNLKDSQADKKDDKVDKKDTQANEKDAKLWNVSNYAIMANSLMDKKNHINDGLEFSKAIILPRKMLLGRNEATRPWVVCPGKPELADKINTLLEKESKLYYDSFFHMKKDIAFDINWASPKLLAVQFICGGSSIIHHQVNIDPETGKKLELKDIINVKDKDLLPLLNLLKTNDLVNFEKLPSEWYIANDRLYLVQRVEDQDYASSYSLEELDKFIVDPKWRKKKTD